MPNWHNRGHPDNVPDELIADPVIIVIEVVDESKCPTCGGGDEFHNRPKVADSRDLWWWRCYNPDCGTRYYQPETGEVEWSEESHP